MAAGFGLLGLSPAAFWSMTPREIEAALGAHLPASGGAPGRSEMAALMNAFPDGQRKETAHG